MNPGGPHRSRNNAFGCAVAGVLIALAWMPVSPALAFDQQDLDSCANKDAAPDLRIKGCTALIQSGKLSGNYLAAAHWDRGVAHTKRRDFDNAITDLDEAIRLEPQAAAAYDDRGFAYAGKGDLDRAIADYNESIRLDPKVARPYNNRGYAYYGKHDLDRAIADFDEAIRLNPRYGLALRNRGFAYVGKREYDRAIADFGAALRLDPKDVAALNDRGSAYKEKGDIDRAIADFDAAVKIHPRLPVTYTNRCSAYDKKGDFDRAIADCSEAIRLGPSEQAKSKEERAIAAGAYVNRGRAEQAKGEDDSAIADYDEAIRLLPFAPIYLYRASAYFAKRDYTHAIADYDLLVRAEKSPGLAVIYFYRGLANLYSGADAKAVADLSRANELLPKSPYYAVWLEIADKRSNLPSRLAETAKQTDLSKWPGPIVRLYLGQSTPAELLAAADGPNAETKRVRTCQADFYIGELMRQRGNTDDATRLFRSVVADCPKRQDEWLDANAELGAIGTNP